MKKQTVLCHIIEYYTVIQKDGPLMNTTAWAHFKVMTLSKRRLECTIPPIWPSENKRWDRVFARILSGGRI